MKDEEKKKLEKEKKVKEIRFQPPAEYI